MAGRSHVVHGGCDCFSLPSVPHTVASQKLLEKRMCETEREVFAFSLLEWYRMPWSLHSALCHRTLNWELGSGEQVAAHASLTHR